MESSATPDSQAQKSCLICGVLRPVSEFYTQASAKDGRYPYCKPCARVKSKQHYRDNVERQSENNRRYRELYPEKCKKNPVIARAYWLRTKFGITQEFYDELMERQGGLCAICRNPESRTNSNGQVKFLSVDHDHACCPEDACGKCVRGLLCHSCNLGIGKLRDSPEVLRRAASYLERKLPEFEIN